MPSFDVQPQTVVLGTITLTFSFDPTDPSQCSVQAAATGSQTLTAMKFSRHGKSLGPAAALTAGDAQNAAAMISLATESPML